LVNGRHAHSARGDGSVEMSATHRACSLVLNVSTFSTSVLVLLALHRLHKGLQAYTLREADEDTTQ
jgi:hypothetical protein